MTVFEIFEPKISQFVSFLEESFSLKFAACSSLVLGKSARFDNFCGGCGVIVIIILIHFCS